MLVSTLIEVFNNILRDEGDIKVYVANDRGEVNLVTSIPQVALAYITSDKPVVISREQLRKAIEEAIIVIMRG